MSLTGEVSQGPYIGVQMATRRPIVQVTAWALGGLSAEKAAGNLSTIFPLRCIRRLPKDPGLRRRKPEVSLRAGLVE